MNAINVQEYDVLNVLVDNPTASQRELSEMSGYSLGTVNQAIQSLIKQGYIDEERQLSNAVKTELEEKRPENAVILAAGYGMRMIPINRETPKGLVEVKGERLIERLIRQLQEVGIFEIYIVVGFMKEQYEYLIDRYGVELSVNPRYASQNNLYSLLCAEKRISNTYILPCDIWCAENPFRNREWYSWYMVSQQKKAKSNVRVNRKKELVWIPEETDGNSMIGISYVLKEEASCLIERMKKMNEESRYQNAFWEDALFDGNHMIVKARVVKPDMVVEINTYEQLRELDENSNQLQSDAVLISAGALGVNTKQIQDITALKKGMTNRSFLFRCGQKRYIMRIPGEGTSQLINRKQEAEVYRAIDKKELCDELIYINPENGYKITEYFENARVCDPVQQEDVKKCMDRLRGFHEMELKVDHEFDIFGQILFYQSLWGNMSSVYSDYEETRNNVLCLRSYVEQCDKRKTLTHIDAVPDNFLFVKDQKGNEQIRLIDWEYAGMQDPHVDLAMFCIYAMYDREQVEYLIDAYFTEGCDERTRIKIYCYISACGLLWSNWCEYKRSLGVEFGEYSLRQYRFAKDYYRIAKAEIEKKGWCL